MNAYYEWRGAGKPITAADAKQTRKRLNGTWFHCEPIAGTPAEAYLRRRGLDYLLGHEDVRFRLDCSHPRGAKLPAMIWRVWDAEGAVCSLHRTYLNPDGSKAAVDPPKATVGSFAGGAIRLHPACHELVVGEGVESTAAAATILGIPGWAAIACGNLRYRMALPEKVRSVTIAVDHDGPGMRAARAAAARWRSEGRTVRFAVPDQRGHDFADILRERDNA